LVSRRCQQEEVVAGQFGSDGSGGMYGDGAAGVVADYVVMVRPDAAGRWAGGGGAGAKGR